MQDTCHVQISGSNDSVTDTVVPSPVGVARESAERGDGDGVVIDKDGDGVAARSRDSSDVGLKQQIRGAVRQDGGESVISGLDGFAGHLPICLHLIRCQPG